MQGAVSPLTGVWGCAPATPLPRAAAGGELTSSIKARDSSWLIYTYYDLSGTISYIGKGIGFRSALAYTDNRNITIRAISATARVKKKR